jgi:hypothetical protein
MDAPRPVYRHSVALPPGNINRSPAARYAARMEDAEGELEHEQYAVPRASTKRAGSPCMSSVPGTVPLVKSSASRGRSMPRRCLLRRDGRRLVRSE